MFVALGHCSDKNSVDNNYSSEVSSVMMYSKISKGEKNGYPSFSKICKNLWILDC